MLLLVASLLCVFVGMQDRNHLIDASCKGILRYRVHKRE
jgi:hypothetical protein